jgi:hypothetical protein
MKPHAGEFLRRMRLFARRNLRPNHHSRPECLVLSDLRDAFGCMSESRSGLA